MARGTFPLFDRILGGELTNILRTFQQEGLSANEIAYRLRAEHDVDVSHETVRRWLRRIAVQEPAA